MTPKDSAPPASIGFILADDFSLSAFARCMDFFRAASAQSERPMWAVMSHEGHAVRASCDVSVAVSHPLIDPGSFDYVAVIGGTSPQRSHLDEATSAYLAAADNRGVKLVGLCSGSFILARLGLMRDRACCVHRSHHQDYLNEFPGATVICDRHFLVDRDRITCGGGLSTAHLAAYLSRRRPNHAADVLLLEGMCL